VKTFFLLAALVITQVLGDIWLSRAMKSFGEANPLNLSGLAALIAYVLTNYWIWLGIGTLILSLFLYFIAVSRLDLSYVLPIHASNYVFNALFARLILGETVSVIRWLSAIVITFGVFIVSISENPASFVKFSKKVAKFPFKKGLNRFFLFLTPVSLSASKFWMTVMVIVLADAGGDLSNAIGMRQIGPVKITSFSSLMPLIHKILTNRNILRGIACQTIAFFSFISILSWADISLVRPATALTYVFTLLGARFILNEQIGLGRLIGMMIVGCGVALVGFA
jgi:transporter family protein